MCKILITGGLGHIGSYFLHNLPVNYDITVVDNLLTQRYCSLFNLKRKTRFIEDDFINLTSNEINNFDTIIHLAAITDAASSFKNTNEVWKTNVNKTKDFFSRIQHKKHIIFPSSTSVYGTSSDLVTEKCKTNPQSPYAESKIEIENFLKFSSLNYTIFRFGTIVGVSPGMRFHTAVNKFCWQASFNQPLTVWEENYKQFRPYLSVSDCLQAIQLALENKLENTVYNVLTKNLTTQWIVDEIKKYKDVKINFVKSPLLNQFNYKVNFDKITDKNFSPKSSIKKQIKQTLKVLSK